MKSPSTRKRSDSELIDLEKWQEERLSFMQNSAHQYDKLATNFQKEMIAKFASDAEDANKVRDWLVKRKIVDYWPDDSFDGRLTYLLLLVVAELSDTYRLWDLTPTSSKLAYVAEVKKAADRLADLLESAEMQPVPPVPPLWYFLSDHQAESLLTVIDRSRTHRESANMETMLGDIKQMRDRSERAARDTDEFQSDEPDADNQRADNPRKYRLAAHLYNQYCMPERWQSYGHNKDTPFLDASNALLIRGLGEYHASITLGDDTTHDNKDRQIKMFAKKIFSLLKRNFDVDERPNAVTAAIVRLHFGEREVHDQKGHAKLIDATWIKVLAKKL